MLDQFYVYIMLLPLVFFILKAESKIELFMLYFISTYIISYVIAYWLNIRVDVSSLNDTNENNLIFINLVYLFYVGYFIQKIQRRKSIKNFNFIKIKGVIYIYDTIIITLLLVEFYLTDFSLLYNLGNYGSDVKDTYIFEYLNIVFVFYLANNKRLNKKLTIYILLHSFFAISDGNRLMAVGSLLIIFIQYVKYIPKKTILPSILLSFAFLQLIGIYRSGLPLHEFKDNFLRDTSFNSHQGSVIYSTLSIIDFGKSMDLFDKILMSSRYTLSLFLSQFWLPDSYNFTKVISLYTYRPGGGMLLGFFYAFFGYIGGLISGYIVSYSLSWGRCLDKGLSIPPHAILLIILMPRYFAYTPMHLFKTVLLALVLQLFFNTILKTDNK